MTKRLMGRRVGGGRLIGCVMSSDGESIESIVRLDGPPPIRKRKSRQAEAKL